MIDAVRYAIIPNAKIVSRRNCPPEKRSTNPRNVPRFCSKNCCSLSAFTPGVGICPPRRYTASRPSVNRIRLRRSGMRKMFASFSNILLQDLEFAAGFGDFLLRRLGKFVRLNGESHGQLTVTKHLDGMLGPDHARLTQQFRCNRGF